MEHSVPEDLHPVEVTHTGAAVNNCSSWEGLTLKKFMEYCFPLLGHYSGAGESVRNLPTHEEGETETIF